MRSERFKKIVEENIKFEKESPYNFCDRWCERCSHEKQIHCKLYQDEFEQRITCLAHGRDPDDPEITEEVMRQQFEDVEEKLEQFMEENEINLDDINDPEFEKIRKHIEFVENNPLDATTEQYRKRVHEFLKNTFYNKKISRNEIIGDFETIAWYHTLLPVKLHRALCGFHEPVNEDEFALYDAVAQFEICKKAINESLKALRKIYKHFPKHQAQISEFLALLSNVHSRIELLEESI